MKETETMDEPEKTTRIVPFSVERWRELYETDPEAAVRYAAEEWAKYHAKKPPIPRHEP
jgi:hypothetical protein